MSKQLHRNTIDPLISEGLIKFLPIEQIRELDDYNSTISENVYADSQSSEFMHLCNELAGEKKLWKTYIEKIPDFKNEIKFGKYKWNLEDFSRPSRVEVELPFALGESIMINHSLVS